MTFKTKFNKKKMFCKATCTATARTQNGITTKLMFFLHFFFQFATAGIKYDNGKIWQKWENDEMSFPILQVLQFIWLLFLQLMVTSFPLLITIWWSKMMLLITDFRCVTLNNLWEELYFFISFAVPLCLQYTYRHFEVKKSQYVTLPFHNLKI